MNKAAREELIKRIDEYLQTTAGALAARDILRDCRAALLQSEPVRYVPMTHDELWDFWEKDRSRVIAGALYNLQLEVIRLAGLEVQE